MSLQNMKRDGGDQEKFLIQEGTKIRAEWRGNPLKGLGIKQKTKIPLPLT